MPSLELQVMWRQFHDHGRGPMVEEVMMMVVVWEVVWKVVSIYVVPTVTTLAILISFLFFSPPLPWGLQDLGGYLQILVGNRKASNGSRAK
jgi:hypothetical protein